MRGESLGEPIFKTTMNEADRNDPSTAAFFLLHGRRLDDEDDIVTSNDSQIIRNTLRIYGSIYFGCFLLFAFLRRRYNRLFNVRSWSTKHKSSIADREYSGYFSWIWEVFTMYSDDEIMDDCGLDAICFLRALRFGRRLCYVGCFNAVWLIPMYRTANTSEDTDYLEDPLVLICKKKMIWNVCGNCFLKCICTFSFSQLSRIW